MSSQLPLPPDNGQYEPQASLRLDISRRALSIARLMDRLPEGNYVILLDKSPFIWRVDTNRIIPVQDLELKG